MGLPITYDPIVRGYSKPFPTAFFGISPMKSTVLIVQCVYEKKYYDIMVLEVISWAFARIFADPRTGGMHAILILTERLHDLQTQLCP